MFKVNCLLQIKVFQFMYLKICNTCFFQIFFFLLVVLRVITFVAFAQYDTACMIFEHASVIDCHQDSIFPRPDVWVLLWILLQCISSFIFVCILHVADELKWPGALKDVFTKALLCPFSYY